MANDGRHNFSDSITPVGATTRHGGGVVTRTTLSSAESKGLINFSISLRMRNFDELQSRIRKGELLSHEDLEAHYLPDTADYTKITNWLTVEGFTLTLHDANHTTIFARGTVSQVARAFGVTFSRVATKDGEFSSVVTAPSIPTNLGLSSDAVLGINGLQPHLRAHPRQTNYKQSTATPLAVSQPIAGNPGFLAPADIAAAYHTPGGLNGSGQTIAIVIDAIPLTSDLTAFWTACGINLDLGRYTVVNVTGGPANTGVTNPSFGEATMDVQWASGIAPGAAVRLYAIPSLNSNDIQTACVQILNDAGSIPSLKQVSMSFGNVEALWSASSMLACAQVFAQLAAQGVSVFAASGDGGSNPNTDGTSGYNASNPVGVNYPASDPNVTAVGGTVLSLNQDGTVANETAWSYSGGGLSNIFYRPSWQTGTGVPTGPGMRCVPDLAAVSVDSGTLQGISGGTTIVQNQSTFIIFNGAVQSLGGTSLSSPIWAAFGAMINQARTQKSLPPLGLLGPRIYPMIGTTLFADVTAGNNGVYAAGAGYDLCTGIGVPNLANLVNALANGPALTSASSTTFTVGNNGSFTVTATGTPAPTFSAAGLPAWATLNSTTGVLSGTPSTTTGSPSTITITATNGINPSATQTFTLDVNQAPVFTSANQASFTVGTAGSFVVTAIGKPAPVFTYTQLPSWAVFNPETSVLSGTPNTAMGSPYTVTITASNGVSPNASQTFTITVNPAGGIAFTSPDKGTFQVGLPITSWQIAATGNPTPTFTATGLPSWASLSSAGNLAGAPPTTDGSPFNVTITAHNGVDPDVTQKFSMTVGLPTRSLSGLATTTFAGQAPASGSTDGTGLSARFKMPAGVAVDSSGNVYVADTDNNTIRKITPAGLVTTLAGLAGTHGATDGLGSNARFWSPSAVAVDGAGNVYVADTLNSLIRKITPVGVVTTLAGHVGSNVPMPGKTLASIRVDGSGSNAGFGFPNGIAVDPAGNVYVGDTLTVRKITPEGLVTTVAGQAGAVGSADGTGLAAKFNGASGIALDNAGNLYVSDMINHTIRKITPSGVVTTVAGQVGEHGSTDGSGAEARFWNPYGIAVDGFGTLYVADSQNYTIRKISPAGFVSTLVGSSGTHSGSADGLGLDAQFFLPSGVAVDATGNVYVADQENNKIRKITPIGAVTTLAGPASVGSTNGTGSNARFFNPMGVAADIQGNLYVADADNCLIRKITPSGAVSTLAGRPRITGSTDGPGSMATFGEQDIDGVVYGPSSVAVDANGVVYVADRGNRTIRKITPDGNVTTFAGLAQNYGGSDGIGSNARFADPFGVAVDNTGNVYVADFGNSTIRKISPERVVTTLAGRPELNGSADGMGETARFYRPSGLTVDASGVVYVADYYNHTVRKITPAGVVTTLAGLATVSGEDDGVGSAARFYYPAGVALASNGDLYVADSMNGAIRKITPSGMVTTELAGGVGNADGVGSQVSFHTPNGLAIDGASTIYVADSLNNTIRKVVQGGPAFTTWPVGQTVDSGQSVTFEAEVSGTGPFSYQWFKDNYSGSGPVLIQGATSSSYTIPVVQQADLGFYLVKVSNSLGFIMNGPGAALEVRSPGTTAPTFNLSPVSQMVVPGQSAVFTVKVSGSSTVTCQWQRLPAGSSTWGNLNTDGIYSGTTTKSLTVGTVVMAMSGDQFRCIATNGVGTATSNAAVLTLPYIAPPSDAVISITIE